MVFGMVDNVVTNNPGSEMTEKTTLYYAINYQKCYG